MPTSRRTISNLLTIEGFGRTHSDVIKTWGSGSRVRQARSCELAAHVEGPEDLFRLLRDHGADAALPHHSWLNGGLHAVCVHPGGLVASSQTNASFVAELTPSSRSFWATGTAAPCTSLFKPVHLEPVPGQGCPVTSGHGDSLWWHHERFQRRVARAPGRYLPLFVDERDQLERSWLAQPPAMQQAFAEHARRLAEWGDRIAQVDAADERPWWARRRGRERDRAARLPPGCRDAAASGRA